jgi:Tfp pilus assembly protein PilP
MLTVKMNTTTKPKQPNTNTMKADISIAKKKNPNTRKKEQLLKKFQFAKVLPI